jgi:hypothetical protein
MMTCSDDGRRATYSFCSLVIKSSCFGLADSCCLLLVAWTEECVASSARVVATS